MSCKYCDTNNETHAPYCPATADEATKPEAKRIWKLGYQEGREGKQLGPIHEQDLGSEYLLGFTSGAFARAAAA